MLNCAARTALVLVSALGVCFYWLVRLTGRWPAVRTDPYFWAPFVIFLLCVASCFVPRLLLRILGAMLCVGLVLLAMFWEAIGVLVVLGASFILGALWCAVYWERTRGWLPLLVPPGTQTLSANVSGSEATDAAQQSKYISGEIKQKY